MENSFIIAEIISILGILLIHASKSGIKELLSDLQIHLKKGIDIESCKLIIQACMKLLRADEKLLTDEMCAIMDQLENYNDLLVAA